ncbi:hypothetical protein PF005_g6801 [Phytophthora fragariae]|uniref:Uncharacterized protein n=1 Tax=Phytophthora fragariae TaxID=53985 RepID=A0A6A3YPL1_9STRA|nr:hypothetical protein PF009_g7309 [Phytophthora fragariae]KAE9222160.1 hypothetical protein PF005_g6801 [Phytophthora fragariae]
MRLRKRPGWWPVSTTVAILLVVLNTVCYGLGICSSTDATINTPGTLFSNFWTMVSPTRWPSWIAGRSPVRRSSRTSDLRTSSASGQLVLTQRLVHVQSIEARGRACWPPGYHHAG